MFESYFLLKKYYRNHIKSDMPFIPIPDNRLKPMLLLAKIKPGEKSVDLGSGDGKIVIAFAKAGASACGIEIDPILTNLSERKIRQKKIKNAYILNKSFWNEHLGGYDIITIFAFSRLMGKLQNKISKEAKPGCRIICNFFSFPDWKPDQVIDTLYLYIKKNFEEH